MVGERRGIGGGGGEGSLVLSHPCGTHRENGFVGIIVELALGKRRRRHLGEGTKGLLAGGLSPSNRKPP